MNYRNYKLEDFLTDEDFKQWVIKPDADRRDTTDIRSLPMSEP